MLMIHKNWLKILVNKLIKRTFEPYLMVMLKRDKIKVNKFPIGSYNQISSNTNVDHNRRNKTYYYVSYKKISCNNYK